MEEDFEPVTAKQAEATENQTQVSEKQLQTLRDSSQTTTQAMENPVMHSKKNYKSLLMNEYKNMMKLQIVIFKFSLT